MQGVFFRETCRREAEVRGVAGWVRNRADGRVDAHFEGAESAVDAMVAWCRLGPPSASVDSVEVTPEAPQDLQGFHIAPST